MSQDVVFEETKCPSWSGDQDLPEDAEFTLNDDGMPVNESEEKADKVQEKPVEPT